MPNYEDYSKRVILEKIAEEKRLEEFKKVIDRSFERAADKINEQIYLYLERVAKDNEVNIDAAKSLLNSKELKGFHLSLEEYIRLAKGPKSEEINKILKNASNRIHISRLQALEIQKDAILAQLYDEFELTGKGVINAETVHSYGRMIKDLELIGNPPSMSSRISKNQIMGLIDKSWGLGAWNYGAQVYSQYQKTRKVLQEELIQNALGVQSIKQTADNVSKRLLISANNADVLVRTEVTANKSKVEKEQMLKEGIYGYMIQAVLDSRTSRKCRMMDHMKFKTEDHQTGVTAPPFHPRCRTVIVKIKNKSEFDTITAKDISPTRSARDPITGKTYITDNVSYPEWDKQKHFELNINKELDKMGQAKDIIVPNRDRPITVHQQGIGKIYSSNYNTGTQNIVKYMNDNMKNIEKQFGEVDQFVILNQKQLSGGLGAYDRVTNTIYIASELGDEKIAKEILEGDYFAAKNLEEAIIHEFAHKKHRQAIKDLYETVEKGYNSIREAEEDFNRPIREFVKRQMMSDSKYLSKISRNSDNDFTNKSSVFEFVAELFVKKEKGTIEKSELNLLIEVFENDVKTK